MRSFLWRLFQLLQAGHLDLLDLVDNEAQARHVAPHLGQRIWRQWRAFRVLNASELLRGLAQGRSEIADAEADQTAFIRLMMRVRSPTRFSRSRFGRWASSSASVGIAAMLQWSGSPRSHPRKARFSSSVSSRSVLARGVRAKPLRCRVDDIGLYALRSQPAREPEAIAAGLEGDRDACDLAPGLDRVIAPTMKQFEQGFFSVSSFFNGWRSIPGTIPADEPTRQTHFNDSDQRAILFESGEDRLRSFGFGMGRSIGW